MEVHRRSADRPREYPVENGYKSVSDGGSEDLCVGEALKLDHFKQLDLLYCFYHKQWWCHRLMYHHFRRCNGLLKGASLLVMAIGMIMGSVFQNSIIVTILLAVGTVIKGWNVSKNSP